MGSNAAASAAGAAAAVDAAATAAAAVPLPAEDPWVRADPWRSDGHPAGGYDGTTSGRTEKGSTSADASIDRALRKGKGKGGKQKSSEAEMTTPVPPQMTVNEFSSNENETSLTTPQTSPPPVIFNTPNMVGPCGMPMSFGPACVSGNSALPGFSPLSMQHVVPHGVPDGPCVPHSPCVPLGPCVPPGPCVPHGPCVSHHPCVPHPMGATMPSMPLNGLHGAYVGSAPPMAWMGYGPWQNVGAMPQESSGADSWSKPSIPPSQGPTPPDAARPKPTKRDKKSVNDKETKKTSKTPEPDPSDDGDEDGEESQRSSTAATSEIKSLLRRRMRQEESYRPKSSLGSVRIEEFYGD